MLIFLNSLQGFATDSERLLKEFKTKPETSLSRVSSDETDFTKPLNFDDDLESNLTNFVTKSEFQIFVAVTSYLCFFVIISISVTQRLAKHPF